MAIIHVSLASWPPTSPLTRLLQLPRANRGARPRAPLYARAKFLVVVRRGLEAEVVSADASLVCARGSLLQQERKNSLYRRAAELVLDL